jgi:hypothetical protein
MQKQQQLQILRLRRTIKLSCCAQDDKQEQKQNQEQKQMQMQVLRLRRTMRPSCCAQDDEQEQKQKKQKQEQIKNKSRTKADATAGPSTAQDNEAVLLRSG